jgi:hypothetical protein
MLLMAGVSVGCSFHRSPAMPYGRIVVRTKTRMTGV